jgi:IS30 family transposase
LNADLARAKPATAVDQGERQAIAAAVRAGQSIGAVARRFHRSKATVATVARAAGIALDESRTARAAAARRDFSLTARIELGNRLAERVREKLDDPSLTPIQLQQLATAYAILVDKRRLEDGEATARTEEMRTNIRERLAKQLDELAEWRTHTGHE